MLNRIFEVLLYMKYILNVSSRIDLLKKRITHRVILFYETTPIVLNTKNIETNYGITNSPDCNAASK